MIADPRARAWPLLLACARHAAGLTDAAAVAAAADGVSDWDEMTRRAHAHGLLPWLARALTTTGEVRDEHEPLVAAAGAAAARTLWQVRQLGELCAALDAAQVPVLPYKGPALSLQLYGDLALRQSVDLDLVVPRDCYARAREVLARHDLPARGGHSERQERVLFDWLGHAPFGRGDRFVELHWRFADRRFPFALTAEQAMARASRVVVGPHALPLMAMDDLLAVLAMHGARHLYERLEWMSGVARLLHASPDDAPRLLAHATSLRARRMLATSVHMAHRVLGLPVGEAWRRELARDAPAAELAAVMSRELEAHELRDEPLLHGPALQRRYMALVDTRADRARLVVRAVLDPTLRDQEAVALPDAMMPLHRVLRPIRLVATSLARVLRSRRLA